MQLEVKYDRISFLYVDSLIDIEDVPENFFNHAIKHIMDSVIGKSRLHSQCLIFGDLDSLYWHLDLSLKNHKGWKIKDSCPV